MEASTALIVALSNSAGMEPVAFLCTWAGPVEPEHFALELALVDGRVGVSADGELELAELTWGHHPGAGADEQLVLAA